MKQSKFYISIIGFVLGIFLSSFIIFGFSFFILCLVLSVFVYVYARFFTESILNNLSETVDSNSVDNKEYLILISIFVITFGLGILRYEIKNLGGIENDLQNYTGEKIVLTGYITDEPNVKEKETELVVETRNVSVADDIFVASGKVLVKVGLIPEYKYGDEISIKGKLDRVQNLATTTSQSFDYESYLAKDDIYYSIGFAEVKYLSSGHGNPIKTFLFNLKRSFMSKINTVIGEPESTFLGGLLLGAKGSLGKDLQNDFIRTGVVHIVALSGYNITIVAEGIMSVFAFLPRAISMSFGAIGILLFAIMTGGTSTVVRASIMALLVILSKATARSYDITRALLVAGVLMLIQNPKILVFDTSFQLSFMATIALVYVSPIVEKKMTFISEKFNLRDLIVSCVATQIFVLPFILYKMGMLSLVALPANLLILSFIPTAMLFGFLTGILSFAWIPLALPFAFITYGLLAYMLKVIEFFSQLPFAVWQTNYFGLGLVVCIYGGYLWVIIRENFLTKNRSIL